jgi:hypothetical protein
LSIGDGYYMPTRLGSDRGRRQPEGRRCGGERFPHAPEMAHDPLREMARPPFSTIPERRLPVLVVIAPGRALLEACFETMHFVTAGRVEVADIKNVATRVAAERPFAIVIEEDVFAFDPQEFQALGRDVGAEIVTVPAEAARDALISRLLPALKGAFGRWEQEHESLA